MLGKVYFGGISGLNDVTDRANISALVATGTAGLYMHESAMSAAYDAGLLPAISEALSGTIDGVVELGLVSDGVGFFAGWYNMVITANGFHPVAANVNADFASSTFKADWHSFVDAAKAVGLQTIAPVFSPNTGSIPAEGWADPSYALIKAAALYGGGLTIDAPPAFFMTQIPAYKRFVEDEIQWARQNNLRVSVILSPYGDESTFQDDSTKFVFILNSADALPDTWVVENYSSDLTRIGSDREPNSISGVALWVANNAPIYADQSN